MTNAQLTAMYNDLTGKSIKPGSYSKAQLKGLLDMAPSVDEGPSTSSTEYTVAQIATELGVAPRALRIKLRKNDFPRKGKSYIFTAKDFAKIGKLFSTD